MSVTLPGDGAIVATVDVGGEQQQVVQVSNLPTTQPVSGTVAVSNPGLTDSQLRAAPVPISGSVTVSDGSGPLTVDGTVAVSGAVSVTGSFYQATQPVSGTFWQATQPVSGTFWQATQPVSAASLPLPTGAATDTTLGALTETAPASDTASSGLNGRLQRIAQRLTSLIALLPASLGIKTSAASLSVAPSSDGVFLTQPQAATYTSRGGTITTGGTAQQLAASNSSRRGFFIQNNSTGDLWFSLVATAVQSQPSFKIASGAMYEPPYGGCPTGAISIIGATTSQAFSAMEF